MGGLSLQKRRVAECKGRLAEDQVAAIWSGRGFDILARRFITKSGEIDLILADADILVFVEVKARASLSDAAYAVLPRQQRRLLEAAELVLAEHANWQRPSMRFDVALVCNGEVEHIEDAIRYH
ncbi:MAG: YraN family protein [Acidocella sp. 20-57-95]|nr:MAG: YraN family protein [Acidocella sp. 20-57-95]OYV61537.1 MAG: YraN family protein [Acidocella sp. 21-58-7]HQT64949.1 YraN family protein [Acidocella sp.]HQU04354.1 YraN family protein [Acidocella sp.]